MKDGKATFVEVKSSTDKLSEHQRLNFETLESAGISVKVWWSLTPDRLMPWRRFYAIQGNRAGKQPRKARLIDYVRWELA